jgi:hypothetical protein
MSNSKRIILALLGLVLGLGLFAATAPAQLLTLTHGGVGSAGCLPLDCISATPYAAWSTRKLRKAYAGNAITVRRSSDSTTSNIGFAGNDLDTSTLLTFCAATNCFVTTFFDQSGQNNCTSAPCNMAQGTTAQQPQIVTSGSLTVTYNSHAALAYTGSAGTNLTNGSAALPTSGSGWTEIGVANATSGGADSFGNNGRGLIGQGNSSAGLNFLSSGLCTNCFVMYSAGSGTSDKTAHVSYTFGTTSIFIGRFGSGDTNPIKAFINGGTPGTGSNATLSGTTTPSFVGCHRGCGTNANALDGSLAEAYSFGTELSVTDTNLIGNNMATYYGLVWTTVTQ